MTADSVLVGHTAVSPHSRLSIRAVYRVGSVWGRPHDRRGSGSTWYCGVGGAVVGIRGLSRGRPRWGYRPSCDVVCGGVALGGSSNRPEPFGWLRDVRYQRRRPQGRLASRPRRGRQGQSHHQHEPHTRRNRGNWPAFRYESMLRSAISQFRLGRSHDGSVKAAFLCVKDTIDLCRFLDRASNGNSVIKRRSKAPIATMGLPQSNACRRRPPTTAVAPVATVDDTAGGCGRCVAHSTSVAFRSGHPPWSPRIRVNHER